MLESLCKKEVECGELANLQWRLHWCILHIDTSECVAHLHSHSPNLFLRGFWTILTLSTVKNTLFVFRHTLSHFEISCFRMYHHQISDYIQNHTVWKKHRRSLIIWMLSKNVQDFWKVCHSKIQYWGRPPILRTCQISRLLPIRK